MVRGLEKFREHFKDFIDRYVLIGGTACDVIMSDFGVPFRATKDLDIVLCVESLDADFAKAFWEFIEVGGYRIQEKATGEKRFYRFQRPENNEYPEMLELFSRIPDALSVSEGSHLTPIPIDDEVSSLSAILLDEDYYKWIHGGRRVINGVPVVGPEYLVALKAKAWLDMIARVDEGELIDGKSIRKHRNDVFRLVQVIEPTKRFELPDRIAQDIHVFLDRVAHEEIDLKSLGLGSRLLTEILEQLRVIYLSQ